MADIDIGTRVISADANCRLFLHQTINKDQY